MEFKPGTYKKGDFVSVQGTVWQAKRDIGNATAYPKEGVYWTRVENTGNIQVMVDAVPHLGAKRIVLADHYELSKQLVIADKKIHLMGEVETVIRAPYGIKLTRTWGGSPAFLQNIRLIGVREVRSHGITIDSVSRFDNVRVEEFGGNGFHIDAAIEQGFDASHSKIRDCFSSRNTGDGFYFKGGDANCITVSGCDARDNDGVGFNDSSFLGNYFDKCMAHANKRGHYWVTGNNARSTIRDCYGEGDSPLSLIRGMTRVEGGTHFALIIEGIATAHIEGQEINSLTNSGLQPYQFASLRRFPNNMVKVFEWKGRGFQWRFYNADGDTFIDKGDVDHSTIEAAFNEAIAKHKLT